MPGSVPFCDLLDALSDSMPSDALDALAELHEAQKDPATHLGRPEYLGRVKELAGAYYPLLNATLLLLSQERKAACPSPSPACAPGAASPQGGAPGPSSPPDQINNAATSSAEAEEGEEAAETEEESSDEEMDEGDEVSDILSRSHEPGGCEAAAA